MEENQAGITALITAYTRAYHSTEESHKIFDDFVASRLFTPEEHVSFRKNIAGLLPFVDPQEAALNPDEPTALRLVIQTYTGSVTLSRSRFAEECLEQSLANGVVQYVILGAGMDTFAYRHPELCDRLRIFEVDHPATQNIKRQRLQNLKEDFPSNLHLVSVDFAKDDLGKALLKAGYTPEKPGFFSWLGVIYYLSNDAIQFTLNKLSALACPGSILVFDYMDPDAFNPEKSARRTQLMKSITRQVGEPLKTGIDSAELEADLKDYGFRLEENLNPADIETRYFANRGDGYHADEHVHFAKALKTE